jgi:tyrosinase
LPKKTIQLIVGATLFLESADPLRVSQGPDMNVEINIPSTDEQGRVFLTWVPVKATARVVDGPGGGGPVAITLRSAGTGGGLVFDTARSDNGTGTLQLNFPGDGTPASFWIAGEFGKPSSDFGDAVVQAVASDGSVLGSKGVMVRIRKSAATLGAAERDRFLAALGTLNGRGQGPYGTYLDMHVADTLDEMHGNVAFPPWHRAYVLELERSLQNIDPTVTVPYWRFDQPAPNIFTAAFMGQSTGTGRVQFTPGHPLENWVTVGRPGITRTLRFRVDAAPPRVIDEVATMALGDNYDPFQTNEDSGFEIDPHGNAHTSFGAPINNPATAVQDPLFFMLHANVDRLWAKWQWVKHHTDFHDADAFAPASPDPNRAGYRLGDTMWPWNGVTGGPRPSTAPGGPFISSPSTPAPGPQPKVQDMFDYQALAGGDHLGFGYDDVPFELPPAVA